MIGVELGQLTELTSLRTIRLVDAALVTGRAKPINEVLHLLGACRRMLERWARRKKYGAAFLWCDRDSSKELALLSNAPPCAVRGTAYRPPCASACVESPYALPHAGQVHPRIVAHDDAPADHDLAPLGCLDEVGPRLP
jgi:hypothetical protein